MNLCVRIKYKQDSKVTERMMMYSCIPVCQRVFSLFFSLHLPNHFFFLSKMHVRFVFFLFSECHSSVI